MHTFAVLNFYLCAYENYYKIIKSYINWHGIKNLKKNFFLFNIKV